MSSTTRPPTVTAVVPTYNRDDLVGRAIDSILAQTRPPEEIIVVDDGSTDRTAEVVAGYPEVRYVRQENAGASIARNTGVTAATHPWIAFLDSDDVWLPDHLERMLEAIVATGGRARFYFGDLFRTAAEGGESHWSRCGLAVEGRYELVEDGTDWVLLPRQPTMLQASVIRRDAYQQAGGLWAPLRVRHDNHIFILLAAGHPICAVNHVGTTMTSDDAAENRLFQTIRPGLENYETETVLMYADLLRRLPGLSAEHRDILRERLKGGHFGLARIALGKRHLLAAARHAASGAAAFPASTFRSLAARLPRPARPDGRVSPR